MTPWYSTSFEYIHGTRPIHMCDMTPLLHMRNMTHAYTRHDLFTRVTRPIYTCAMTHSYAQHDSFLCVIWPIHMCDMTHLHLCCDSFTCVTCLIHCVTWRIHTCDMTHSYVRRDSFTCATWLIHMRDMTHSYVCDMPHSRVRRDSIIWVTCLIHSCGMGWLRLVGSLKLQVSFAREPYKRNDILQKRPIILRSLLIVATPYDVFVCLTWLIHTCDMTQWYVWQDLLIMWHDLFVCLTWLIHTFDMAYPHVRHDSFMCATWLNHMCFMTHSYAARTWSFDMGKKTEATWNWRELSALREVLIRLWTIMIVPLLTGAARCLYICLHICVHVCECICMHNCTWIGMYEYVYVYIIENELMILLP